MANTLASFEPPSFTRSEWDAINADAMAWEERERRRKVDSRLAASGIPQEFAGAQTDSPELLRWLVDPGYGLLLQGAPGRGKTHAACALLAMAAESRTVRFATIGDLLRDCKAAFRGDDTERAVVARYVNVGFLALDDLGREQMTPWAAPILADIIAARDERHPTIVTTNYEGAALQARLAAPGDAERAKANTSRLARYRRVVLEGPDRRLP